MHTRSEVNRFSRSCLQKVAHFLRFFFFFLLFAHLQKKAATDKTQTKFGQMQIWQVDSLNIEPQLETFCGLMEIKEIVTE